jgi:TorA maturation chaperone TorD
VTAGTPTAAVGRRPDGRWELLRALGAYTAGARRGPIGAALCLAEMSAAEHTRIFVLDLPPYASIHLGPDGNLGGEGADRVAGLWRALGLQPPSDADHLASLLALFAELGAAAGACRTGTARRRLGHARAVLLGEHLVPWLPGYLTAVDGYPAAGGWARLARAALRREVEELELPDVLPAALRDAPPAVGYDDVLDAVVAPVRAGFVLTHQDLQRAGSDIGVGVRRGERRYVLEAMLGQDAPATLGWLAGHARGWATHHRSAAGGVPSVAAWWCRRATESEATLEALARRASISP